MKAFKDFIKTEGILDDMVSSFPDVEEHKLKPAIRKVKPTKHYAPRKFKGVKQTEFSEYIRSESYLKLMLKDRYKSVKMTLKNIIDLYATYNYKLADNLQPKIALSELHTIREYDRDLVDGWTGKSSTHEIVDLSKSIKIKGITDYGVVNIVRKKNGSVTAILGEGNHRVNVGMKVKAKKMPIMFFYTKE